MDGTNPISGAQVTLYEATSTSPIVLGQTTSQANGTFLLSDETMTRPGLDSYVYLVAKGGKTGSSANNSNINLVEVLGQYTPATPLPTTVAVNELTTVASYQTLTSDWDSSAAIPTLVANNANTDGLAIGLINYQKIINPVTGGFGVNYPIMNLTGEQEAVQANVLALCVQDTANCTTLSGNTYLNTGSQTDTFSLMVGLKTASTNAITNINTLLQANSSTLPYPRTNLVQNALGINYQNTFNFGSGIQLDIADPSGNIWIVNNNNLIVELQKNQNGTYSPVLFSGFSYGFNSPRGIAIDPSGNLWVSNPGNNSVTEIENNADHAPHIFTSSMSGPGTITSDPQGNIWVVQSNSTIAEIENNTNHTIVFYTPFGLSTPNGIASDPQGNIWVANTGGNNIIELENRGNGNYLPATFSGFNAPTGIACDSSGNVWVANNGNNNVIELQVDNNYFQLGFSGSGYNFQSPQGITVDANDNIWVTNSGNNSVTEIENNTGHTPQNYTSSMSGPGSITSDSQGNIWVLNNTNNTVTELALQNGNYSAVSFPGTNYEFDEPQNLISDNEGNIWLANAQANNVIEIPGVDPQTPILFSQGFDNPSYITSDSSGNIWIANAVSSGSSASSLTEIPAGTTPSDSPVLFPNLDYPVAITSDPSGNIWLITTNGGQTTVKQLPANDPSNPSFFTTDLGNSTNLTSDPNGNIWLTTSNKITEIPAGSTPTDPLNQYDPIGGTGLVSDPSGNIWVANGTNAVIELPVTAPNPPITTSVSSVVPSVIVSDALGNIWVADINANNGNIGEVLTHANNALLLYTPANYAMPGLPLNTLALTNDKQGNIWVLDSKSSSTETGLTEILN